MFDIPKEVEEMIQKYVNTFEKKYRLGRRDDAFQEGVIAYLTALQTFNIGKGDDIDKWVRINIHNSLRKFYNHEAGIDLIDEEEQVMNKENKYFNLSDEICDGIAHILTQITFLEKVIMLERLKGNSYQSIAKEIKYPKNKVQNIFEAIIDEIKGEI